MTRAAEIAFSGYTGATPTLRFASFAIDVQRHLLLRGGEPVDLSPRLVDILSHLASNAGQVVSKESLLDRFWADLHVTDNRVPWSVTQIRKALGDEASHPTFIQTVAGEGYRFVAPVDASGAPAEPEPFEAWTKGRLVLEALDAEQLDDATAAFARVLAADESYAPAHAALANACILQYERTRPDNTPNRALLERAITLARRGCTLDRLYGEAWAALGFALTLAGAVDPARTAARKATMLQSSSWRHQFRLSMACWGEERLDAVDRTLTLMPGFAPAHLVAAMVFVARQAFPGAEEHAARGAARQSLQRALRAEDDDHDSRFPAFGLHWLLGLLQLRRGEAANALASFDREVNEAHRRSIYFREYRVNALVGGGYAHLAANDPAAAEGAFRRALEVMPSNGRARLGLQQACSRNGLAADAASLALRLAESIAELTRGGRLAEVAMLQAAIEAAQGRVEAACEILNRLLRAAPPGQVGWTIPIDPALASLREHAAFESVLARLAERAV